MIDYSENIIIKVYSSDKNEIINRNIEELIPEMVAAQIDIDFKFETIKVQSIIARTMLIRKSIFFGGEGCANHPKADICLTGHCGSWISKDELKRKWGNSFEEKWKKLLKAERETSKLIITLNNKVINPRFHSSCGGSTENSEDVDGYKVVYLRKVLCDNCMNSPDWQNSQDITLEEIQQKLDVKMNKISPFYGSNINGIIEEIERDDTGRVVKLKIGDKMFKGTELREALGLDSTSAICL